jgi:dienelactone hydrolase
MVTGHNGINVPVHCVKPFCTQGLIPVVIAIHGVTSSKHEWTEIDGYTKGGNVTRELVSNGIGVVAVDLHYHGDNSTQNMGDHNMLLPENWNDFCQRSIDDIQFVIDHFIMKSVFDCKRIGFIGYSMGNLFGYFLANKSDIFRAMVNCVPPAEPENTDPFSSFKNIQNIKDISILQVNAENDEYIFYDFSVKLFDQLQIKIKKLLTFESGHSLPCGYVPEAVNWLKTYL